MKRYFEPITRVVGVVADDRGLDIYSSVQELSWARYRAAALRLDPKKEEARLNRNLQKVEDYFGLTLKGEVVLFGAFRLLDGYARFNEGKHRVYLGIDECHGRGAYLDILTTHELTHVARESRPEVWTGHGLDPKMNHDDFVNSQPVIEHLFSEGYSCAVSEILIPGENKWHYTYQSRASLARVLAQGAAVDRVIKRELKKPNGNYITLYDPTQYGPDMPMFCHYVWAWQWVKTIVSGHADGKAEKLLSRCSKDFIQNAIDFKLK